MQSRITWARILLRKMSIFSHQHNAKCFESQFSYNFLKQVIVWLLPIALFIRSNRFRPLDIETPGYKAQTEQFAQYWWWLSRSGIILQSKHCMNSKNTNILLIRFVGRRGKSVRRSIQGIHLMNEIHWSYNSTSQFEPTQLSVGSNIGWQQTRDSMPRLSALHRSASPSYFLAFTVVSVRLCRFPWWSQKQSVPYLDIEERSSLNPCRRIYVWAEGAKETLIWYLGRGAEDWFCITPGPYNHLSPIQNLKSNIPKAACFDFNRFISVVQKKQAHCRNASSTHYKAYNGKGKLAFRTYAYSYQTRNTRPYREQQLVVCWHYSWKLGSIEALPIQIQTSGNHNDGDHITESAPYPLIAQSVSKNPIQILFNPLKNSRGIQIHNFGASSLQIFRLFPNDVWGTFTEG